MGALARMTEDLSVIPPSRRRNADCGDLRFYFGNARICLCVTFITASSSYTVSVGVPTFLVRGDVYFWGSMMAACLIASVPIAIIYNFFVTRFVADFTMGAIK